MTYHEDMTIEEKRFYHETEASAAIKEGDWSAADFHSQQLDLLDR